MFCNQTSLKGFSTFSTISLAFSIALVIPALLKPFTDISLSSGRVLCRSTIHIAVMKKKLQLSLKLISQNQSVTRQLVSQNWSVTLKVVAKKKKTSTLKLILMNQLTWPLINFLFLKCKGINKYF